MIGTEEEKWLTIKDFNTYEVSSTGRIRNRKTGRILKVSRDQKGYERIGLCSEAKQHSFLIHRIVATAFIDNPSGLKEVNHKNRIKYDQRVENLEWVTHKENIRHSIKTGKRNVPRHISKDLENEILKKLSRKNANPQRIAKKYEISENELWRLEIQHRLQLAEKFEAKKAS